MNERIDTADEECIDCGYEPELQRTLGSFQIFAISFAFISVAVGIFATYDSVLATAGPVGILRGTRLVVQSLCGLGLVGRGRL